MADVELIASKDSLVSRLTHQVHLGRQIVVEFEASDNDAAALAQQYFAWDDFNVTLLERAFKSTGGWLTQTPASDYRGIGIAVVAVRLGRSAGIPADKTGDVLADIAEKSRFMEALADRLDLYESSSTESSTSKRAGEAIFIVHGHAHARREEVRRFLESVTTQRVIVLDDEANQGRDVLGKLLDNAYEAAFAVVLLTGDDEGRLAGSATTLRLRARQNVILELGLFLGLLGRDRVAALYESGVEVPSDFSGILYTKLDEGGWQVKLGRELKAAGIEIDLNRAL